MCRLPAMAFGAGAFVGRDGHAIRLQAIFRSPLDWEGSNVARSVIIRRRKVTPFGPFKLEEVNLEVERRDGSREDIERINFERGDSVAALIHRLDTNEIILVRQFRYSVLANAGEASDGMLVEIAAGIIDPGETPYQAIRREVVEELGYELVNLQHVATFFVSPGGTSERNLVFFATVQGPPMKPAGGISAEGEDIETVVLPFDLFIDKIRANELRDAKTLLAGYWLLSQKRGAGP